VALLHNHRAWNFLIQGLCEEAMNRKNTTLKPDEPIEFEE
jgi:hypothetical protein